MRIQEILDLDCTRALLEDGRVVDVSHQSFCTIEMFGSGHDEECDCLEFDEEGSAGQFTKEELEHIRLEGIEEKTICLHRIRATFPNLEQYPSSERVAAKKRLIALKSKRPDSLRRRIRAQRELLQRAD